MPPERLELCGLDPASLHRADRLQDNTNPQMVNILKVKLSRKNIVHKS